MSGLAKYLSGKTDQVKPFKKGGVVKHDDVKEDKAMIAAEFKKRGLKCGGKAKK